MTEESDIWTELWHSFHGFFNLFSCFNDSYDNGVARILEKAKKEDYDKKQIKSALSFMLNEMHSKLIITEQNLTKAERLLFAIEKLLED